MATPTVITSNTQSYQSIYTLSGVPAGTRVHIDVTDVNFSGNVFSSATQPPPDTQGGLPLRYEGGFNSLDTEANDVDVWIIGDGYVSISQIPTE